MNESAITPEGVARHNLTPDEYQRVLGILGRTSINTELQQFTRGTQKGVGNPVFYVRPATGREGLADAAVGSRDLAGGAAEPRDSSGQRGDPFMEKPVCEARLELIATGVVAGMQAMGVSGLAGAISETAARAGTGAGIEIDLDQIPQRTPKLSSGQLILSESPDCMLLTVQQGHEEAVVRILDRWNLPWFQIGVLTNTGNLVVRHGGQAVVDVPARKLADEASVDFREAREPAYREGVRAFRLDGIPDTTDPAGDLRKLLANQTIASKNWVYRQYDPRVRDDSSVCPGSDATVIRITEDPLPVVSAESEATGDDRRIGERYVAFAADCNGTYLYLDPYEGGKAAVAEACRNLACVGAVPAGSTDQLNFGDPHHPEIFWQLRESVRGLAEGCLAFRAPITGGNVSLDHQRGAPGAIDPRPAVAVVGVIDDARHLTTQWFKDEGDAILLLGAPVDLADPLQGLGGSAALKVLHGQKNGLPPRVDLEAATVLHTTLIGLIHEGVVKSAHDCSDGGLAVALAECCFGNPVARETFRFLGATVDLTAIAAKAPESTTPRLDALLFGETQNRVVISVAAVDAGRVLKQATIMGVPTAVIGKVGGDTLTLKTASAECTAPVAALHDPWWNSIARAVA